MDHIGGFLDGNSGVVFGALVFGALMLIAQQLQNRDSAKNHAAITSSEPGEPSSPYQGAQGSKPSEDANVRAIEALEFQVKDLRLEMSRLGVQLRPEHETLLGSDVITSVIRPDAISRLESLPRNEASQYIEEHVTWDVIFESIRLLDSKARAKLLHVLLRQPALVYIHLNENDASFEIEALSGEKCRYEEESQYRSTMRIIYDHIGLTNVSAYLPFADEVVA